MGDYLYSMDYYLQKTPEMLQRIISDRKELLAEVLELIESKDFNELILLGSGSSYTAGLSVKYFLQNLTGKTVTLAYPNNVLHYEKFYDPNALVVGVSQSGNSVAAINSVKHMKELGYATVALTSNPASDIAHEATVIWNVGIGEESSGPKTLGYSATVLQFILLALEYAHIKNRVSEVAYHQYFEDLEKTIEGLPMIREKVVSWYESHKEDLIATKKISVVGYGSNYGTALEGSLKLIETVRCPSFGYEFEEFLHGPNDGIDKNSTLFLLQTPEVESERMDRFYHFAEKITSESYLITSNETLENKKNALCLPFSNKGVFTVLEYVVPLQYLAYRISKDRGIDLNTIKYPEYYTLMNAKTKI